VALPYATPARVPKEKSHMPHSLTRAVAGGALLGALAIAGAAPAAPSGAAFTTDVNGTVNQNLYAKTTDVYLNGGPCNASPNAVRLPDGWHEYRVTDPSGRTELSTDSLDERMVRAAGGTIVETSDPVDHPIFTTPCGPAVRVGPFAARSRKGVYKLWIAPQGSGFARNTSKTDNFRVKRCGGSAPLPPPPPPPPPPAPGF
jgi:hypothetical protein